jgi:hypothetical protein
MYSRCKQGKTPNWNLINNNKHAQTNSISVVTRISKTRDGAVCSTRSLAGADREDTERRIDRASTQMIKSYTQSRLSRNYVLCSSSTLFCVFNYPLKICIPQINLQIFTLRDVALSLQLPLAWMVAHQTALNNCTSNCTEWLHIKLHWKFANQTALNGCTSTCTEWLHNKLHWKVAHQTALNGCTSNYTEWLHIKLHWMTKSLKIT